MGATRDDRRIRRRMEAGSQETDAAGSMTSAAHVMRAPSHVFVATRVGQWRSSNCARCGLHVDTDDVDPLGSRERRVIRADPIERRAKRLGIPNPVA